MPRVIFHTATTLNGYLADDEDSLDWLFAVPGGDDGDADFAAFLSGIGLLVMGSATYEWVVSHDDLLTHPEKWAEYYGDRPTVVFTSRDLARIPATDIRFVSGDVRNAWPMIEDAAGDGDVWIVRGAHVRGVAPGKGLRALRGRSRSTRRT